MTKAKNFVSVIIVNWNGKKWLSGCLSSISKQSFRNFEVILVDNASTDESVAFVRKNYPDTVIVKNHNNLGFSGGANAGIEKSKGMHVLFLNNDTVFKKDFIEKFIKAFDEIPNLGTVQSKVLLMGDPKKLDTCGSYWTDSSFLYHYGVDKDQSLEKYNKSMPFFSNMGAAMMIRREIIDRVGMFDSDFWNYYEDTDFCNRVWMAGYECWYYPKAVIYHARGMTSSKVDRTFIQFNNFKNKLLSFLKNFEKGTLTRVIPTFLALNVLLSIAWLFQGRYSHSIALYKAIWWNMKHLAETMRKRKEIQKIRVRSDKDIFSVTKKNPRLSYYRYLFTDLAGYKD